MCKLIPRYSPDSSVKDIQLIFGNGDTKMVNITIWEGGMYSHTSGIYGFAALMCGFLKRFAHIMGAFLSIPAPIMGTFLEILPPLGVINGNIPSKLK